MAISTDMKRETGKNTFSRSLTRSVSSMVSVHSNLRRIKNKVSHMLHGTKRKIRKLDGHVSYRLMWTGR